MKIKNVLINPEKDALLLQTDEGEQCLYVTADCCSKSWIEHISGAENLINAELKVIEGVQMDLCYIYEYKREEDDDEDRVTKFYSTKITTDKGVAEIEYRNESNGYYGASIEFLKKDNEGPYGWKGSNEFHKLTGDF